MSAERTRQFLDTNVLVYAHDTSAGDKRRQAIDLLEEVTTGETAALSIQVLQEFFVSVTSKLPNPLPVRVAAAIVADLGVLPTHVPVQADVLAAINLHERLKVSFWDAMVLRSASQLGCAVMWSEDLAPGRVYEGVEIRNPFS